MPEFYLDLGGTGYGRYRVLGSSSGSETVFALGASFSLGYSAPLPPPNPTDPVDPLSRMTFDRVNYRITATPVPEPDTAWLALAGCAAALAWGRFSFSKTRARRAAGS